MTQRPELRHASAVVSTANAEQKATAGDGESDNLTGADQKPGPLRVTDQNCWHPSAAGWCWARQD
jgi:hypothetical protein